MLLRQLDRFGAIAGLSHDLDVGRQRQQRRQPFAHQALIIGNQNFDGSHFVQHLPDSVPDESMTRYSLLMGSITSSKKPPSR